MCGIIGYIDYQKAGSKTLLQKMRDVIAYRGPDSTGSAFFESEDAEIALGHRRLSILDLSDLGSQPMAYEGLHIVHNGEVYNFRKIRDSLIQKGYRFISDTDTEVILKAYHAWGAECVKRFRGMFAFAIYDEQKETVTLFRDRAGVKPLYYYFHNGLFLFGSELKSFYQHPSFEKEVEKKALPYYFRFGYIPAPLTIFRHTYKLLPGHYLTFRIDSGIYREDRYWSVEDAYVQPKKEIEEDEAVEKMEGVLREAFSLRMVADVPVGVFLSGGVDSTLVIALLQKQQDKPLQTFTIGFEEKAYNEAEYAKEIARYLGTSHTELYCTQKDMLDVVQKLPEIYDEPFGDSSAIPTHLVSKLASDKVTVVLSGDGGDEAFCGYSKYFALEKIVDLDRKPLKKYLLKRLVSMLDESRVEKLNNLLPTSLKQRNIKDKYHKFKSALESEDLMQMFTNASSYVDPELVEKILVSEPIDFSATNFSILKDVQHQLEPLEQMMLCDYKTFMADDVLTKVDRASMSVSIEAREPLLDHKIIEFSAMLPIKLKYKKYLLKKLLYRYLPKQLIERPKSGFQIPLFEWLQGELKPLVQYYLREENLYKSGIYDVPQVRSIVDAFYKEKSVAYVSLIWFLLMYEMWREQWMTDLNTNT